MFLNAEKSVGGHVKKFITSSFFNKIIILLDSYMYKVSLNKGVKFQIKIPNS